MDKSVKKTNRRALGVSGEQIACQWYSDHGYDIVDRNVNISHVGEIDIIASRTLGKFCEVIFAEVKTRSGSRTGYGYEAITIVKRTRMARCAMAWLGENVDRKNGRCSIRLDVVSIDVSSSPPTINVFENIEY